MTLLSHRLRVPPFALNVAAAAVILVATGPLPCASDTHTVRQDGSGHFITIQEAVAFCSEGDTVLVGPGSYVPSQYGIDPGGFNITIISEEGPDVTMVDATGRTRAFCYQTLEGRSSRLEGFTIVAAQLEGLKCEWASPTVVDCWFIKNRTGVRGEYASPAITGCVFLNNGLTSTGKAVHLVNTDIPDPLITDCTFFGRLQVPNDGGVLYFEDCYPIVERTAITFSGGKPVDCGGAAVPDISHCIIFGHAGGDSLCGNHRDNLFADPLWCNVYNDDLEVCENSPCLPENNLWGVQVGPMGQGCGECVTPVEANSWGTIKAMFR